MERKRLLALLLTTTVLLQSTAAFAVDTKPNESEFPEEMIGVEEADAEEISKAVAADTEDNSVDGYSVQSITVNDAAGNAEGKCGENAVWILGEDGTLRIEGNGEVTSSPWYERYHEQITAVFIGEEITDLGDINWKEDYPNLRAFACDEPEEVDIPVYISFEGILFQGIFSEEKECDGYEAIVCPLAWENESGALDLSEYTNVYKIHAGTFQNCKTITSIELPPNMKEIGDYAFADCSNLTKISIPDSVDIVGAHIFEGCHLDKSQITHTHTTDFTIVTTEPTCTEDGSKKYLCKICGEALREESIDATGHNYGKPEWKWEEDNTAEAVFKCKKEDNEKIVQASIAIDKTATTDSSCIENGKTVYIAAVELEGKQYTDSKTVLIPALGHDYSVPKWNWSKDNQTAEAIFTCTKQDDTEAIAATMESATIAPSCTTDGKTVYTAAVELEGKQYTDSKTVAIPALGHDYSEPQWSWSNDNQTAEAIFTCTKQDDTKTMAATIKSKTIAPTCEKDGKTEYTATVVFQGKSYSDTRTERLPKTDRHVYCSVITKAKPGKSGSIAEVCAVCGESKSNTEIAAPKSVLLSKAPITYNGKAQKPSVTIKDETGSVIASKNYTVTYAKGRRKVGSYPVTIRFQGDKYTGELAESFTIVPKGTTIRKVTAISKGVTAKWFKQAEQTSGYELQYSTNRRFKNAKHVSVSRSKTVSKKIVRLKAKKKYYVRIRTYKLVGGKKYYSAWSKAKTGTTKK